MCFSAIASFSSSVVLAGIAAISIKKATTSGQNLLGFVALFFCLQQFIEGIVWLSIQNPAYHYLEKPATYGFLVFAQVVWPAIVPLTILMN